jgi:predicted nucleotidyltransferase
MKSQAAETASLSDRERETLDAIKRAVSRLAGGGQMRMIIFGSKARGDADDYSDIDLAIIVPGLDRRLKNVILDAICDLEIEHDTPVSALVMSVADFDKLLSLERRIALDIEKEGIEL